MCPKCRELPTHYAEQNTLWEEDSCVSNNRTVPRHSLSFVTGWMRTCSAFNLRGWELPGRMLSSLWGFESELHLDVAPHEGVCASLLKCSRWIRIINSKNSKGPGSPTAYKSLTSNRESFWVEVMLVTATCMDLEVILLSEGIRKRQAPYDVTSCGISNMTRVELSMKQKQTHRHKRTDCGCQEGRVGVGRIGSLGLADANCYI